VGVMEGHTDFFSFLCVVGPFQSRVTEIPSIVRGVPARLLCMFFSFSFRGSLQPVLAPSDPAKLIFSFCNLVFYVTDSPLKGLQCLTFSSLCMWNVVFTGENPSPYGVTMDHPLP